METIYQIFNWCFGPDPYDIKHQQIAHPIFTILFGISFNVLSSYTVCKFLMRYKRFQNETLPSWGRRYALKFLLVYITFMAFSRFLAMGFVAFYEMLWACNGSIINLILGLYMNCPLLVVSSFLTVGLDQVLWYADLFCYVMYGSFEVGVMNYLTWPQTSWASVLTSTHHLWFMPLCFILLLKCKRFYFEGFFLSAYCTVVFCFLARITVPKEIIYTDNKSIYLNVNSIWDSWKDVKKFYICSCMDGYGIGSVQYFLYVQFFWNTFNIFSYTVFNLLHNLVKVQKNEKEKLH